MARSGPDPPRARDRRGAFTALITELMEGEPFELLDFNLQYGASDEQIESIQTRTGLADLGAIAALCRQLDGLSLEWRVPRDRIPELPGVEPPAELYGSINLLPLEEIFIRDDPAAPWQDALAFDGADAGDAPPLANLRPFDWFNADRQEAVCLQLDADRVLPHLAYFNLEDGPRPLEIGLDDYLDLLLETRGLVAAREARLLGREYVDRYAVRYLELLFPGGPPSTF